MTELFTVPITRQGLASADGYIKATQPAPKIYLLTFTSPPDNRLTSSFLRALHLALCLIETRYPPGVLITTSGIPKFYSNGLDLKHVYEVPRFWQDDLYPVFAKLSSYPMPTVALLNGHAFAGGLILAMHHDYRVMNPAKGYACMNEVDFGALMETPMLSIFREKLAANVYRDLILEAKRFGGGDAAKVGIVDGVATGLGDALAFIEGRSLVTKGNSGVYGRIKEDMYRQTIGYLKGHEANVRWRYVVDRVREEEKSAESKAIEAWEAKGGKAEGGKAKL